MAVPTAPSSAPEQRSLALNLDMRMRKLGQSVGRPLFAVILAMIAGGIVIMITSPGSLIDRFNEAIAAYQALLTGAFGNPQNLSFTLTTVTPLILAGLSVAIAYRVGLFNIGAAGKLAVGAMTAGIIAFQGRTWSVWGPFALVIIGAML